MSVSDLIFFENTLIIVYKQRFLVLVKNSKSVRNKLAKSAPLSRKLRNKTSQKKSGNPAQFIPRSWKTDRDSKQNQCCQFWRFCAKLAIFEQCLAPNISVGDWRFFGDFQFFKIVQTKLRFPAKLSQNFHKIFTKFSQNYYKKN